MVEEIIERSGTPNVCFMDIDENKPTGSIKIRVETIGYFLKRYREDMVANRGKEKSIDEQLRQYELQLRAQMLKQPLGDNRPRTPDPTELRNRRPGGVAAKGTGAAGGGGLRRHSSLAR